MATLLYHIAAIEIDWLYNEVLMQDWPPGFETLFPHPVRDDQGRLFVITGLSLTDHLDRLEKTRGYVLNTFREMTLDDFRRPRHLPDYEVTPEWVLHHLAQHESEHRGEMQTVYTLAQLS